MGHPLYDQLEHHLIYELRVIEMDRDVRNHFLSYNTQ